MFDKNLNTMVRCSDHVTSLQRILFVLETDKYLSGKITIINGRFNDEC